MRSLGMNGRLCNDSPQTAAQAAVKMSSSVVENKLIHCSSLEFDNSFSWIAKQDQSCQRGLSPIPSLGCYSSSVTRQRTKGTPNNNP